LALSPAAALGVVARMPARDIGGRAVRRNAAIYDAAHRLSRIGSMSGATPAVKRRGCRLATKARDGKRTPCSMEHGVKWVRLAREE